MNNQSTIARIVALAFLFGITAAGLSAASVQGKVLDPQSKPVAGARVSLYAESGSTSLSTDTDTAGAYTFENIDAGSYLIEARASGFSLYREEGLQIHDTGALHLDLKLDLSALSQQISVTASSTPQPVEQISKALTVVDNSSLQERQDYSLLDAVRLTPGVRTQELGGPLGFSEIRIRGLRPEDTAVLVDGLRLRDPSATQADASGLLEDFMVTDASRIEVLRGSGSSLYGTDAIGGVVNVITDQGGGKTHGSVEAEGGGLGLVRGAAQVAGGTSGDGVQYSVGLMHLNVMDGVGGDAPARDSSVQGRVGFRLSRNTQLVARFFGIDSFSKLATDPQAIADFPSGVVPAVPLAGASLSSFRAGYPLSAIDAGTATYVPSIDDPDYTRAARFGTGALMLSGQPTSKLGYTVDYQIVNSTRRYGNGPAGPGYQPDGNTLSNYDGRIQTVNASGNYQAGSHELITAGYEFESEHFGSFASSTAAPESDSFVGATQNSNTAFAQDQVRLFGDRLYLSGAFRAQYFSLQQPTFTPIQNAPYQNLAVASPPSAYTGDGSVAYFLKRTQTKLRAHVGRGYRAPSLYERFGAGYDAFFGYSVYGDPALRPEQSVAGDAGIDRTLFNNKLKISATYFYTRLDRVIAFDVSGLLNPATDPYGRYLGYLNTDGGFARGVEFSANWVLNSSLTVSGAYTYTDAREETPLVPDVYRTFVTPQHQFTVFAIKRIGQRLFVDMALNAASSYLGQVYSNFSSGAFQFPGQKRADLGVSYRIPIGEAKAIRLFGKAENAFNQTYYESGFLTPGVTGRGGLQFEF